MNHTLTLVPEDETIEVPASTPLREALASLGVTVTSPCGGEGTCGKCRVQVRGGQEGLTPPTASERSLLSPDQLAAGIRLSCDARNPAAGVLIQRFSAAVSSLRSLLTWPDLW